MYNFRIRSEKYHWSIRCFTPTWHFKRYFSVWF